MSLPVWCRAAPDGTFVEIVVQPRASREGIGPVQGDRLKVRVHAPPVEDAANEAVVRLLAEALGVPRSAVTLAAGRRDAARRSESPASPRSWRRPALPAPLREPVPGFAPRGRSEKRRIRPGLVVAPPPRSGHGAPGRGARAGRRSSAGPTARPPRPGRGSASPASRRRRGGAQGRSAPTGPRRRGEAGPRGNRRAPGRPIPAP